MAAIVGDYASLDLNHFRYFQTIARCGSISAAARELGVSQPALTVAMQQLEAKYRTTLALRGQRGVTLTRTGEELLHHVDEIFSVLGRVELRIAGLERGESGSFVIGCNESLGTYFLPAFMSSFFAEPSEIEVRFWNGSSAGVREAVVAREVDFGLVVNPPPHPDLVLVELFKDALDIFVASSASGAKGASPPDNADEGYAAAAELVRKGPLVYPGRVSQCQALMDRLASERLLPQRVLPCGDIEMVKSMALAGVGLALLPRRVAAWGNEGKLRRLHPMMPFAPNIICLAYRADFHRTRAAIRLKDALVAHGRRLSESG